jgi:hypothetical protein
LFFLIADYLICITWNKNNIRAKIGKVGLVDSIDLGQDVALFGNPTN